METGFSAGKRGVFDFGCVFERVGPINEPLREETFFARVFLENGALAWPNGFDLSARNVRDWMEAAGMLWAREVAAK